MNGWRIWCEVDCNGRPLCLAYELTGIPFLPRVGEPVCVPIFDDGSGDLIDVKNIHYWALEKYITLSLEWMPKQDEIEDLIKNGWA